MRLQGSGELDIRHSILRNEYLAFDLNGGDRRQEMAFVRETADDHRIPCYFGTFAQVYQFFVDTFRAHAFADIQDQRARIGQVFSLEYLFPESFFGNGAGRAAAPERQN